MKPLIPWMQDVFEKHGATILTVFGAVGVVGTAVLAVSETPKALDKIHKDSKEKHDDEHAFTKTEAIKSAWSCYIPAGIVGMSTIACILGSNAYNKHTQASITNAAGFIASSYNEYKNKVKELYGEETHNKIVDSIMKDHCEEVHITTPGLLADSTLEFLTTEPEVTRTFYDTYSKRYFESTESRVLQAEYHFNRNYTMRGGASINEFYEFLGLEPVENGDEIGFSIYDLELMWVDFDHHVTTLEDGLEVCVIDYPWYPEPLTDESVFR